jgi:hypothetical protein
MVKRQTPGLVADSRLSDAVIPLSKLRCRASRQARPKAAAAPIQPQMTQMIR